MKGRLICYRPVDTTDLVPPVSASIWSSRKLLLIELADPTMTNLRPRARPALQPSTSSALNLEIMQAYQRDTQHLSNQHSPAFSNYQTYHNPAVPNAAFSATPAQQYSMLGLPYQPLAYPGQFGQRMSAGPMPNPGGSAPAQRQRVVERSSEELEEGDSV